MLANLPSAESVREQARSYEKRKHASLSDFQRNIHTRRNAPYRRPSKAHAEEVMRHGCRKSRREYRDVLSRGDA